MVDLADTICALSTPPGRSGIAVVRLSGSRSFEFLQSIFTAKKTYESQPMRRAVLGQIADPRNGFDIDEAIAICFPNPDSFTGEDMVELSIHGSPVLVAALLDCLNSLGARLAEPGEFSMRAFLHSRIDLSQAEAIHDIISATTLYQAQVAARQHRGAFAHKIKPIKKRLIDIIVNLESAVEFVEEELPLKSRELIVQELVQIQEQMRDWIDTYRRGRIIKEGFSLAIIGRPNVGKSSLFNALLAQDRSIVNDRPGTTRDLVSEYLNIEGIPVRLLDTAGIQHAEDQVEKLGIDKSLQAIADADAILFVIDLGRPCIEQDYVLREQLAGCECIAVMNKNDLISPWSFKDKDYFSRGWPYVEVSAKTGAGIRDLRCMIVNSLLGNGGTQQDSVLITNLRHVHSLKGAEGEMQKAVDALQESLSEEFALMHLHSGLRRLGEITGETVVEDLLGEIFARFCVGK
jgi:tRNA modification GTPase